jgi:hypothetical protein
MADGIRSPPLRGAGKVAAGMRDAARVRLVVLAVGAAAALAAGCGDQRQDADAPSGTFSLDVTDATFPPEQRVAEASTMRLDVANTGDREVPDLAVTVETEPTTGGAAPVAFGTADDDPALAASARPVWVVDRGPAGGESAYVNTWTVGPLGSGRTRPVTWKLTAIRPGDYTVRWRLSPSLEGDAELADGTTSGEFQVRIDDAPVSATVNGDGEVVRGD